VARCGCALLDNRQGSSWFFLNLNPNLSLNLNLPFFACVLTPLVFGFISLFPGQRCWPSATAWGLSHHGWQFLLASEGSIANFLMIRDSRFVPELLNRKGSVYG
jgi:hypothetical protein